MRVMIIDCHTHMGKGMILEFWWAIEIPPELVIQLEEKAGVDKAVIFPVHYPPELYDLASKEVFEAVRKYPDKLIPFAKVAASHPKATEYLRSAIEELGVKGLKLHSSEGYLTRGIMDLLQEHDLPLLIHTDERKGPLELVPLLKAYPDVKVIIAHLGSPSNYYHQLQAMYLAERFDNVYLDTSVGSDIHENLRLAVERAGVDRILFGSDAPVYHPAVERRKIELLELNKKDEAKILGENLKRMLKLA